MATDGEEKMSDRQAEGDDSLPVPAEDGPPLLAAEVVVFRDRTAECTMYPPDASALDRHTAWLTAAGEAFVSLDEVR
jgi:hypothetical protein